jgi:hypothetical protein
MPRVIANFGKAGAALVDDADYEVLIVYRYRLDCYGLVVRSAPAHPGDVRARGVRSLARDVGDLMGLPSDRQVTFRDGNQMNATRANLAPGTRRGIRATPRAQQSQPPGVHRVKLGRPARGQASSPPPKYALTYHEPPCVPDNPRDPGQLWQGCSLARDAPVIGSAKRITSVTNTGRLKPAGWDVRTVTGERRSFASYFTGVKWMLERYLDSAGQPEQILSVASNQQEGVTT